MGNIPFPFRIPLQDAKGFSLAMSKANIGNNIIPKEAFP